MAVVPVVSEKQRGTPVAVKLPLAVAVLVLFYAPLVRHGTEAGVTSYILGQAANVRRCRTCNGR